MSPRRVFPLGLTVIELKEKRETGSDVEVGLVEDYKVSDVEHQVRCYILRTDLEVVKNLAEEEGTRGLETPGNMIGEENNLTGSSLRQGLFFVQDPPVDLRLRQKHAEFRQLLKPAITDVGLAPVTPCLVFRLLSGDRAGRPDAGCALHLLRTTLSSGLDMHFDD